MSLFESFDACFHLTSNPAYIISDDLDFFAVLQTELVKLLLKFFVLRFLVVMNFLLGIPDCLLDRLSNAIPLILLRSIPTVWFHYEDVWESIVNSKQLWHHSVISQNLDPLAH